MRPLISLTAKAVVILIYSVLIICYYSVTAFFLEQNPAYAQWIALIINLLYIWAVVSYVIVSNEFVMPTHSSFSTQIRLALAGPLYLFRLLNVYDQIILAGLFFVFFSMTYAVYVINTNMAMYYMSSMLSFYFFSSMIIVIIRRMSTMNSLNPWMPTWWDFLFYPSEILFSLKKKHVNFLVSVVSQGYENVENPPIIIL